MFVENLFMILPINNFYKIYRKKYTDISFCSIKMNPESVLVMQIIKI
jgi:hypothetical protein